MSPIFVAVDTPELERARTLAENLRGSVGGLKLGLEFFSAQGPAGVAAMRHFGLPIFLDLKLHDIPNTVAKAIQALRQLDPEVLTIHAAGGRAMLEAAKAAAGPRTKVVAVTVLTSLDDGDLADTGVTSSATEQVERLAALSASAGIDGIVCSGAELAIARRTWPNGFFVVPGLRPAGSDSGDQKRVMTPRAALDDGASILVIGRPITEAGDPAAAARNIAASIEREPEHARI
jgi:orotidine-5'-phosphate decarboxylase